MRSRAVYRSWNLKYFLVGQRDRGLYTAVGISTNIAINYSLDRQQLQVSAQSNYESKLSQK